MKAVYLMRIENGKLAVNAKRRKVSCLGAIGRNIRKLMVV